MRGNLENVFAEAPRGKIQKIHNAETNANIAILFLSILSTNYCEFFEPTLEICVHFGGQIAKCGASEVVFDLPAPDRQPDYLA